MEVIGIWSAIDLQLASMTTLFLKADYAAVISMLNALTSSTGRSAAINAAAESSLSKKDLALFNAVQTKTKASRDRRNDFSHHVWGYSDGLMDALLLTDPRYLASYHAERHRIFEDLEKRLREARVTADEMNNVPNIDNSHVYVYRIDDLNREIRDARLAFRLHEQLNYALSTKSLGLPDRARDVVCQELFALVGN